MKISVNIPDRVFYAHAGSKARRFTARKGFLTICLLLFASVSTLAQITLKVQNVPVDKVLREITRQTGYTFVYKENELKTKTVTADLRNATLRDALEACFSQERLEFQVIKKTVVLKPVAAATPPPGRPALEVHGHIYDDRHQPLAGVSVRVLQGLFLSAATNENGIYVLRDVPAEGQLIVSFIGFKTDTVSINGHQEIDIVLHATISELKSVTVSNGYQTINKERSTGSFAKPDMQLFNARTNSVDILSRLEGLAPGLVINPNPNVNGYLNGRLVMANNLQDGNNGANLRPIALVRGVNSVSLRSEPLYVVNGIAVTNMLDINPDDIADITVLKDASAAAIWGAKAANGVVVVNTKRGNFNQRLKVSYSGYVNFMGKPDLDYIPVLNSKQYIQAAKEVFDPADYPYNTITTSFVAPHEQILYDQLAGKITAAQADASLDSLAGIDNRGQIRRLLYQPALSTHHTVAVSGGGAAYSFYAGMSFTDNQGNSPGTSNKMYQIDLNQVYAPNKRIKIGLNTSLNNILGDGKRPIVPQGNFFPYQLLRNANGNDIRMNYEQGLAAEVRADYQQRSRVNLDYYPLQDLNTGYDKANSTTANITGTVSVKILKGLSFDGTYGYARRPGSITYYDDITNYKMRRQLVNFTVAPTAASTPVYYLPNTGGKYVHVDMDQRDWTVRNQLIYNIDLRSGKDHLGVQVGQESREQKGSSSQSSVYGYNVALGTYPLLDYKTLSNGMFGAVGSGFSIFSELPFQSIYSVSRFTSLYGLFNYSFNNKYSLELSIRRDRSNVFAATSAGQNPFSAGLKWRIKQEDFMADINWINELAIRGSYGIIGNAPGGNSTSLDVLNARTDPTTGLYYSLSSAANDKLSWERTRVTNIGLDYAFLHNRISGTIDFYFKKTDNLLGSLLLNPLTGFPSGYGNIGSLSNKGIELALKTVNIRTRKLEWTSAVNLSYNKNKLLSYPNAQASLFTASGVIGFPYIENYPLFPLFAYNYAGLDGSGDPQIRLADGTVVKTPNAGKSTDVKYMGTQVPPLNGSFVNMIRYGKFSVTANIIYNLGGVMRRDVNRFYTGRLSGVAGAFDGNVNKEFADRWKKPGDEKTTDIPGYVGSGFINYTTRNTDYYRLADINVISSSYFKLRDLTLAYDLPAPVVKRMKMDRIGVFAQTGNYMLWRNNKYNIDPEFMDTQGARLVPPYKHTYSIGANVTF